MGKAKDLTGMKFGKLTVIERAENRGKKPCWLCECECGTIKTVRGWSLTGGHTTSCGCAKFNNLIGQKFGRLTVIEKKGSSKRGDALWLCKCECGNEKIVCSNYLTSGDTTSCGCLRSEKMKKLNEEQWQDDEFRQIQSERAKEHMTKQWQDDEFRQMRSELMTKQWQDDEFREQHQGNKCHLWKGGTSPISTYLRSLQIVQQWRKDTYARENSKCQLTGKKVHGGNSDVHHLYGFNMIVREAHDLHNIKVKPQVKEYTEEELQLLEDYVTSCHTDTTNAVLLSEDVHDLFHSLYGKGDNTPEQYEEFKTRYLNGEFENSDSNNNKVA